MINSPDSFKLAVCVAMATGESQVRQVPTLFLAPNNSVHVMIADVRVSEPSTPRTETLILFYQSACMSCFRDSETVIYQNKTKSYS